MKKYQVLVFIFFLYFKFKDLSLCNMVCLNQDPVNFKAFTDNSQRCSSLSVVLHVYAKDECHSWWHNSNFSEREITLIADDSLNIIFCTHILIAVYIKSGICAICKINCYTKTTKSCHILIYQKKIIWTHILSQPVSFQHHILVYMQHRYERTFTNPLKFQFLLPHPHYHNIWSFNFLIWCLQILPL